MPAALLAARIALAEYAAVLLFGALTLLFGLPYAAYAFTHRAGGALDGFADVVLGVAQLAVVAFATLALWQVFIGLGGRLPRVSLHRRSETA